MTLCWRVRTILLLILVSPAHAVAEGGMVRWFSCGIGFWRPCEPPTDPPQHVSLPGQPAPPLEPIAPEALQNWGTPVVGPSGALSYQLPPRPLLDLFQDPTDANARTYLTWLSEKTQHREAAFAAIKRMAAEVGYSVGKMPASDVDSSTPAELLAGVLPTGTNTGKLPQQAAVSERGLSRPQGVSDASESAPTVTLSAPASSSPARGARSSSMLGPRTRVLYFFAPHCPYCAQETPLLSALLRGRADVVGIAMDTTREALLTYLRTARLTFPVTLDQGESQAFGITGYPAVVVREDTGAARKLTGLATREQLQQVLKGVVP